MAAVSIRYQNGTTVEANNLGDALVHLMHTGTDYVVDVVEQAGLATRCARRATGPASPRSSRTRVVLTREQVDEKVARSTTRLPATRRRTTSTSA
jgi:hypothetical protein